jgi:hypothetical protein
MVFRVAAGEVAPHVEVVGTLHLTCLSDLTQRGMPSALIGPVRAAGGCADLREFGLISAISRSFYIVDAAFLAPVIGSSWAKPLSAHNRTWPLGQRSSVADEAFGGSGGPRMTISKLVDGSQFFSIPALSVVRS